MCGKSRSRTYFLCIQIVDTTQHGGYSNFLCPLLSPAISYAYVPLSCFFVSPTNVIRITIGRGFGIFTEIQYVSIFEKCYCYIPMPLLIEIFDTHVRIIFQSEIIVDIKEIIVSRIWKDTEWDSC